MASTAWADGHRFLYHWDKFCEDRLRALVRDKRIYCSNPANFNDPWDCKPHFNADVLKDSVERQNHAQWALNLCQRKTPMPSEVQERMRQAFLNDPDATATVITQISEELAISIAEQYRVYCLAPDPKNLLMWSHYADSHRGICLEFSLRNKIFCSALKCEYASTFPTMKLHDDSDESALISIITGCQSEHERIHDLVKSVDSTINVKRAVRAANRFEISII